MNIAISENVENLTFYLIGDESTVSTLDYSQAIKMSKILNLDIALTLVKCMPLSKVFDTQLYNKHIDFMSIDVEGHELAVLKSNNWKKYRPTLIMVELNIKTKEILLYMDKQDYLYVYSNHLNALFVDKKTKDTNILSNITWDKTI